MPAPRSRPHLAALLLASTALPVLPAAARAEDRAIQVLLDQANYWRGQGRTDQVIRALERVLAADPDNVAALSGLAQAQAQQGDRAAADRTLARLRQVAPGNSVVGSTETQLRGASADPAQVAEARRLAQAGQNARRWRATGRSSAAAPRRMSSRRNTTRPRRGRPTAMPRAGTG
ncbi:tetratricopeptide repeat protein [Roseomonas mucosa]|nr:tetratricopeptide repeat protein [Roseomonas mucosa]